MSGLKINLDKSKAIWIGSKAKICEKICHDLNIEWVTGEFDVLGIKFTPNFEELWVINTRKRLEEINRNRNSILEKKTINSDWKNYSN